MKRMFFLVFISLISKLSIAQSGDFYNLYFEGNALLIKGQYDKAIDKYNQAGKLFEKDFIYYNRGNAYLGKKDYANAMIDYNKAIKKNSNYAEAYCQRGLVKMATFDITYCDDFKKAMKMDLEDAKALMKKNCK